MMKEITSYFDDIEDNNIFKKFITYYEKNWFNNQFIRFEICYDKNIKIRTDNACEGFHRKLNQRIEYEKPKNSLVCNVLKEFAIESFKRSVEALVSQNIEEKKEINIFSQCYDYLYEYHLKYHKELDFSEIKKLSNDPEGNIDKITILMLSLYKDSYVKNLKNIQNLSDQNDNADESDEQDNEIEDEDKEEKFLELTNKICNVSLSDELEIENYDDACEGAEGKQNKYKKKIL